MEPGSEADSGSSEEDQEDPHVEQEFLPESGPAAVLRLIHRPLSLRTLRGDRVVDPRKPFEHLTASRTFLRVQGHARLAGRALRDDLLRLGHDLEPAPAVERYSRFFLSIRFDRCSPAVPLDRLASRAEGRSSGVTRRPWASRATAREFVRSGPATRPASADPSRRGGTNPGSDPPSRRGPRSSP